MKFRKPVVEPIELNLTPMIDCLLFLVVFLLLSTTFNKYSRLNLILPQATGVPEQNTKNRLEINVSAEGRYAINGAAVSGTDEASLRQALRQVAGTDRQRPLTLAADGRAPHQAVVRVMDVAGKLGFVSMNISTRVPAGQAQP
jgi:biopolymer transport protein ExbD